MTGLTSFNRSEVVLIPLLRPASHQSFPAHLSVIRHDRDCPCQEPWDRTRGASGDELVGAVQGLRGVHHASTDLKNLLEATAHSEGEATLLMDRLVEIEKSGLKAEAELGQ